MHVTLGRLTATWVVLRSLKKLGEAAEERELLRYAQRSGLRGGGLPISDGYEIAVAGGFLEKQDATTQLTEFGRLALGLCPEQEPNADVLRLFLSVLVLRHPPTWAAVYQGNPDLLEIYLTEAEIDMLKHADLFPQPAMDDLTGWSWWEALRHVPADLEAGEARKAVGDAGELLSLRHEQERLRAEGYPELAAAVRWVARESPAYGFDVASFAGASYGRNPNGALAVEVKSLSYPSGDHAVFYLTRHEMEMADRLGDRYIIHYWDGVNPIPQPTSRASSPRVILPSEIQPHLPRVPACGDECHWETTKLRIQLLEGRRGS